MPNTAAWMQNQMSLEQSQLLDRRTRDRQGWIIFARRNDGCFIIVEIKRGHMQVYSQWDDKVSRGFTDDMLHCIVQKAAEHRSSLEAAARGGIIQCKCDLSYDGRWYTINVRSIQWPKSR